LCTKNTKMEFILLILALTAFIIVKMKSDNKYFHEMEIITDFYINFEKYTFDYDPNTRFAYLFDNKFTMVIDFNSFFNDSDGVRQPLLVYYKDSIICTFMKDDSKYIELYTTIINKTSPLVEKEIIYNNGHKKDINLSITQEVIDSILDKIAISGVDSLSSHELDCLNKISSK